MPHTLSEVHREHLPVGRYNAGPGDHDSAIDPGAQEHAVSGHGVHNWNSHVHHAAKVYRSVADGLYGTELFSAACCALFALLAVIQLAIAAHMLLVLAPTLARSSGATPSSGWVRGKARWVAALVPGAVARCCALLLLISDLSAKAGGAGPWNVSFIFEASSFFDACSSWLFYTYKVATLTGWAMCLHGPGRQSQRLLAVGALASLALAVALAVTVSFSLSYGSICLETHDVYMCQQRQTWYATFHVMMVVISLGSMFYFASILFSAWRKRGARDDELVAPWLMKPLAAASGYESTAATLTRNNRHREAAAIMPAANVCAASVCWWSIFNLWGAMRAARLVDCTAHTVEMAVAANWVLSEFVPGLVIALVLFFQVRREISRSPAFSTDYHKLAPKEPGGGQDGVLS